MAVVEDRLAQLREHRERIAPGDLGEGILRLTAGIRDLVVTVETTVGQMAVAQLSPNLFGGIHFR